MIGKTAPKLFPSEFLEAEKFFKRKLMNYLCEDTPAIFSALFTLILLHIFTIMCYLLLAMYVCHVFK